MDGGAILLPLAGIRERAHRDGSLTWAVLWRDQDRGR